MAGAERVRADVVVVGGGPAGVAAAEAARAASGGKARVVLVDDAPQPRRHPAAPVAARLREAAALKGPAWEDVRLAARAAARPERAPRPLAGVETVQGRARFTGPDTLEVERLGAAAGSGPLLLQARRVVLATGATTATPDVTGLAEVAHLCEQTLLDADELLGSVALVGAGPTGCALAQALARLGQTVTLLERADGVLPGEHPAVVRFVRGLLEDDGVRVLGASEVVTLAPTLDGGAWVGTHGTDVAAERLVLATGRRADVAGLDLPAAGVRLDADGDVVVDDRLRTANRDVLAVTGAVGDRHAPLAMARLAGANAVARMRPEAWTAGPSVRVLATDPAVAVVGPLDADHDPTRDVALEEPGCAGVLAVDATGRVRGGVLAGPGAVEAAPVLALATGRLDVAGLADLAVPGTLLARLLARGG